MHKNFEGDSLFLVILASISVDILKRRSVRILIGALVGHEVVALGDIEFSSHVATKHS